MKNENRIMKWVLFGTLLLAACSLLLVTGCDNPVASGYKNIPDGQGTVTIRLAGSGRTIMPAWDAGDIDAYQLTFTPVSPAGADVIEELDADDPDDITGGVVRAINLLAGTYTLKVDAYAGLTLVATKSTGTGAVNIEAGENTGVNITLELLDTTGTGIFEWEITLGAGIYTTSLTELTTATMTLKKGSEPALLYTFVDDTVVADTGEIYLDGSLENLSAGMYTVTIEFEKTDGARLIWEELLYVYGGLTSTLEEVVFTIDFFRIPTTEEVLNDVYDLDNVSDWVSDDGTRDAMPENWPFEQGYESDNVTLKPAANLYYIKEALPGTGFIVNIPDGWEIVEIKQPTDKDDNPVGNVTTSADSGVVNVYGLENEITVLVLEYQGGVQGTTPTYDLLLVPTAEFKVTFEAGVPGDANITFTNRAVGGGSDTKSGTITKGSSGTVEKIVIMDVITRETEGAHLVLKPSTGSIGMTIGGSPVLTDYELLLVGGYSSKRYIVNVTVESPEIFDIQDQGAGDWVDGDLDDVGIFADYPRDVSEDHAVTILYYIFTELKDDDSDGDVDLVLTDPPLLNWSYTGATSGSSAVLTSYGGSSRIINDLSATDTTKITIKHDITNVEYELHLVPIAVYEITFNEPGSIVLGDGSLVPRSFQNFGASFADPNGRVNQFRDTTFRTIGGLGSTTFTAIDTIVGDGGDPLEFTVDGVLNNISDGVHTISPPDSKIYVIEIGTP